MPPIKGKRQTQPAKFGIDHFFARHKALTQQQTAGECSPKVSSLQPESQCTPTDIVVDPTESGAGETEQESRRKRVRLSPLLQQTQDDGADEVIWKQSPTAERLQAGPAPDLPEQRVALRPCQSNLVSPCSKISPCISSKLEEWLSDPSELLLANKENILSTVDANSMNAVKLATSKRRPSPTIRSKQQFVRDSKRQAMREAKLGKHRKVLLELLDQVQTAITQEIPAQEKDAPSELVASSGDLELTDDMLAELAAFDCELKESFGSKQQVISKDKMEEDSQVFPSDRSSIVFLVKEVSDSIYQKEPDGVSLPQKVLRLSDESNGVEKSVWLRDEWVFTELKRGDAVRISGDFQPDSDCIIDHEHNLLVAHPELVLSGSRVASSFSCPRRAVLDERIKAFEFSSSALLGTMLHRLFQTALSSQQPSKEALLKRAEEIVFDHIEGLYAVGVEENDARRKLTDSIPTILTWYQNFTNSVFAEGPNVDFGVSKEKQRVSVLEVVDIEEMVWSPKYGLKGMIDASVRVRSQDVEEYMPLELKTGRATTGQAAMEHRAQVILYTLLMSDRYSDDVNKGILYYLHANETQGVAVRHADVSGLMMRRNEYAGSLLRARSTQVLPPMLQSSHMCKGCRMVDICSVYHKVQEKGTDETSGLAGFFNELTQHLNQQHANFLRHWDMLIDLEGMSSQSSQSEIWRIPSEEREQRGRCISSMILKQIKPELEGAEGLGNHAYTFEKSSIVKDKGTCSRSVHETFVCGDYVVLSTESGHVAIAAGVIKTTNSTSLTICLPRPLRLPRKIGSMSDDDGIFKSLWRVDKDDRGSSFAIMRYNLLQLFVKDGASNIRRLVVDLEAPEFVSLSQDSAAGYLRTLQHLNDDQRNAIQKILTAKDYALVLGMPGTGKTSTLVHAVKALLAKGLSILLASYTNSAVDNILLKLKQQRVDFLRVGRTEAIHPELSQHAIGVGVTSVEDLRKKIDQARVVGATCFGITHALFSKRKFDVCIIDEAGQITLPMCLGPLRYANTFVLVGDHYQLPPLVQNAEARDKGMAISLFRRLSEAHPLAVSALACQYRMCSAIMNLSNTLIYEKRLRCGSEEIANASLELTISRSLPDWTQKALDPNQKVLFLDTDAIIAQEKRSGVNMVQNITESSIALHIISSLRDGGVDPNSVGVISPYKAQIDYIVRRLAEKGLSSVEAHTIDKYQGRDKDCILLSFVRSNSQRISGSLLTDWHRINVAITRAKKKLIFIGSSKTLSSVPLLKLLIDEVRTQGGFLSLPEDTLMLL